MRTDAEAACQDALSTISVNPRRLDLLLAANDRYERQYLALTGLTRRCLFQSPGLSAALAEIAETAADVLDVARVSIWRLEPDHTAIVCQELFERPARRHSSGGRLGAEQYPNYFRELRTSRTITANDAAQDPATAEFRNTYLEPLGITSMLDAPLQVRGALAGVLCLEHVGTLRRWSVDEQSFAVSLATLVSLMLEAEEHRRADAALHLQSIALESAANAIVITSPAGEIEWVNPAFTALTGYTLEESLGRNPRDLVRSGAHDPDFFEKLWRTITAGLVWRGEIVNRRKDGTLYTEEQTITPVFDRTGAILHYVAIKQDVSARKRSEEERARLHAQLLQSQKLESVGRLAGGVAHDFNNMLSVILGHSELLLEDLPAGSAMRESLEEIRRAATRSADLTRQLLAFSRRQMIAPKVLDLNDTVGGMLKMLRRLIGEDIELVWIPAADLWPVEIDPTQVDQMLANLTVNARDAISGPGTVTIRTANVTWDEPLVAVHEGARPGQFVRLTVSDSGCGMSPDVVSHIFEPFFTTKAVGEGTGLGLATVYGIVRQNEGFISVYSEPGQGAAFNIYLPRCERPVTVEASEPEQTPAGRGETILLVEDEEAILMLERTLLEGLGYRVLTASTPMEALRHVEEHAGPIDLLLTDVVMPQFNGQQLADRIEAIRPGIPRLFVSGYPADIIASRGVLNQGVNSIQKPFGRQELAVKLRDVLDAPHTLA